MSDTVAGITYAQLERFCLNEMESEYGFYQAYPDTFGVLFNKFLASADDRSLHYQLAMKIITRVPPRILDEIKAL
jgi:hypothetical protein